MRTLLLDTHSLIWWRTDPDRLRPEQLAALETEVERGNRLLLSVISLWEMAKLIALGRMEIDEPLEAWLAEVESHRAIRVVPLSAPILAESVSLSGFHRDPADEIIVATARVLRCTLVTADAKIRRWGGVAVL